ncbi:rho GTPase-activating protein 100F isoform X2 [Ochlerotatus camptorhynchus]|uniref:rho GTPase-activating protein 100F isoform X2 n=1 Tax=Ochlerotatus camptorhynchus TaxID=644619 RepID=UPI0031D2EC6F
MQWRKFARLKTTATGHSRTRRMLCCGRRKENGRSVPDLTASPGRAPPGPMPSHQQQQQAGQGMQQHHPHQGQGGHMQQGGQRGMGGPGSSSNKEPVLLQGDFRKVSGISSEIFRQIEAVENDHDPSTAAALEAVERRGEMIVRILEPRCMGSRQAVEAGQKFLNKADARHTVQLVEIVKRPGQTLGLYIREGNGADRSDGVFISRIALESAVYNSGCLRVGDEILAVNLVDVTRMSLDDVVIIMSIPRRLVLAIRQRRGSRGANSPGPPQMSRPEQKPPPVVVIKRDLRDDDLDDSDRAPRSSRSSRERRTGDGREMTESRSRLGLGLNNYSPQSEQLDMYYAVRSGQPVETPSWGYKPPPPPSVITEQPKGTHGFQTSHSYYQNAGTLESLAEKVHSFYPSANRRMSAGTGVSMSQSHQRFPRSGSDQHLPRVEYADYQSLGRHTLLRSSLKTDLVQAAPIAGGTLGRYGRYEPPPSQRTPKYAPSPLGATGSLQRRSRPALDYSSDTEATIGPRPGYYYYNHPAMANTIARGSTQALGGGPEYAKFNSLPRDRPGSRMGLRSRIGERLQDENDGNLSAPEYSLPIRRDPRDLRQRLTASPSIFTSDEYRAWLRRAPSSSAICEQMRASRDILNQQRAHRFSCSAENIHDVLKNTENIYSSRTALTGGTLDRHNLTGAGGPRMSSLPVRSMSSQHIGPSSIRSPSVRRMRQLLELTQGGPGGVPGSAMAALTGHQSPAPTPSTTLPRTHRQIDINPAEYTKYKLDKPVVDAIGMSGMLWIHLLAGRGLRAMSETSQAQQPMIRDLYCVLECDRIHKARTVVRSGDLQFDWDESFELDLVCNKQLDVLVYSWDPQHRHKLCYRGALSLTTLLRQSPIHQLALKVEPRGTIYLRLRHTDPFQLYRRRGLPSLRGNVPALFGADLETVVTRESKGAPGCAPVPIILRRCVEEVERRGLDIIGLYRLCGSATKKRLLREAFERNSRAVELTPEHVPDINVITGVLKDYLRELPEPLFTKCLFQMTVDALGVCLPDDPEGNAKLMLSILDCLPRANRATLVFLLDHLSLVVSASERNKMSAQALATVMGPPLMLHSSSAGPNEEIDHAQPIAVLKYLLQIWPQPQHGHVGGTSGRRGEPVEPRGNKASALPVGKSPAPHPSLPSSSGASAAAAAAAAPISLSSSSLSLSTSTSQLRMHHQPSAAVASSSLLAASGTAAAAAESISRSVASSPSTTSLQLGPHPLSATPSSLPYQSVVAQLAQSHRASPHVGPQPHQLEGLAASAEHGQSPRHVTPSPSSSSTSSASGSGSGTDTIKRGASPASVKFRESGSSYSLKSDTSRILSSSSSLAKKYTPNGGAGGAESITNGSTSFDHHHHPVGSSSSILGNGAAATSSSSSGITNGAIRKQPQRDGGNGGNGSSSSTINNGPNISSSSDLQLPSRSVLFSSDYLSSTSPSSTAATTLAMQKSTMSVGSLSTLDVATFSLDDKNNLVVSPSPSSASESSHHSSNSSLRERSPQPSPSLKRQEPIDRTDSVGGSSSTGGSSLFSSLRSQTLGSYQFPSSTLKLSGQLSADSATSADDGSTSSLLRKLTTSLSRSITSNTGTLPLSLGRQGASSSLYQQEKSYSGGSSSGGSSSGKPTSASLNYASPAGGGSLLSGGDGSGASAVTTAAAVTSMSIYGTLPKNSSIYSYGGGSSGILTGTSSSYGISDRLRALTGSGGGSTGGESSSGLGSSMTTTATSSSSGADSGAGSSAADLGASGYDYESSGFSSTGLTSSYGGASASSSVSMNTSAGSGLSSSYFSTGSGSSPFGGANGGSTETTGSGPPTYRVQYSSTNPFLPSYNPPNIDNGGAVPGNGGANSGRNGGLRSSDEDDSFDMK